ncbi:hypothetical protein SOM22_05185 [Stenotrophomonas rhizophila]|uniref:hypothetical protein n=1 Tax=Stenotrophomonas rhizophila TaxID=216778 RepID=UPI002A6B2BC3|nr:hypothetical protein [Stenotrophomonas rhizophila]MDY0953963.1 hypothetical protein [Stenotrophomonas rhizophila]
MSYPADAFIRSTGKQAHLGSLMFLRGEWVLSARFETPQEPIERTLILTGPNAGSIHGRFVDYGLCTAPDVTAEVRISSPGQWNEERSHALPASLVVADDGLHQLWGHIAGSPVHRYGFTLDGYPLEKEEHELAPFLQFSSYEVWLRRNGKILSDKPLFTVGG